VLSIVDTRADLLDLERTIVGDRYTFIRSTYLQRRRQKAGEAPQRDDFGEGFEPDDSDW
jgi:phospholipid-binding lipoprotein MlaA